MMHDDYIQEYLEMLIVTLAEDVWSPGNLEQFVFTDYGIAFNDEYPMFIEEYRAKISPDVSLNHKDNDWWWDS